ncbi:insulin-like growth factor-binding protein 7 [Penaeus indicus]|uniref:insulin-like growth factor-binding protein 7 n=1 Tax=Penaeus indicus TaxID=29960 RepID=UPI00300CF407
MKTLPLLLLLAVACASTSGWSIICSPCDESRCPPSPDDCKFGVVKDACNCCDVCGKGPYEDCDPENACGPGYYCQLHPISYGNGVCKRIPSKWD